LKFKKSDVKKRYPWKSTLGTLQKWKMPKIEDDISWEITLKEGLENV